MPERRIRIPIIVLIFAFVIAVVAVIYHTNANSNCKKVKPLKQTVRAIVYSPKEKHKQAISVTTSNCWASDFNYQDPRMLNSGDMNDVEIVAENGDFKFSKKISVKRRYLGDAEISFKLKGKPKHEGLFLIADVKGPITDIYSYATTFDKKGTADIVVLVRKAKVTTIYKEGSRPKTFYQHTGSI